MASFSKTLFSTPFGRNVFLRSTQDVKTFSGSCAANAVPALTIDTFTGQKVLQPGTVIAKITSGVDLNKYGPYQAAGTDEVQTITKTGTWSAGTYTLTVLGATTAPILFSAVAATIQSAVRAAVLAARPDYQVAQIEVTGGPLGTNPVVVTFNGSIGADVPIITTDITLITGSTPGVGVVETTPGVAGATDGRQTLANVVGINNTFLPWQLTQRDVEIAIIYEASVVQANCIMLSAAGLPIPVDNTTAAGMFGKKSLDIKFF